MIAPRFWTGFNKPQGPGGSNPPGPEEKKVGSDRTLPHGTLSHGGNIRPDVVTDLAFGSAADKRDAGHAQDEQREEELFHGVLRKWGK
jgi:hypothetical protein